MNLLNCDAVHHFGTSAFKKVKIIDERPKEVSHSVGSNLAHSNNVNQVVKTSNTSIINSIGVPNVAQNVLDNESFAINWLRSTYEDAAGVSFKVNDIYAEYVKYCCRNSRKNVIAVQSFSFLIKRCFPSCLLNANQSIVEGLSLKGFQLVNSADIQPRQSSASSQLVTQHPQLMSPILKAHLSTPPKNNAPNSPLNTNEINSTSTTNTSTLIKSLLANKLRNNQIGNSNLPSTNNSNKSNANQVLSTINSSSNSTLLLSNDNANNLNNDVNGQKNLIFAGNPTTFAINSTQSLANNILVPNANIQQPQHLQGPQQILVVRTILTTPGQQNPVRLILPASMITQQRLQTPVASTVNGLVANNNVVPNQTSLMQNQLSVSSSQNITNVVNAQSIVNSSQNVTPVRSSIANSSPLLNVLLDKGKLPDFPLQNPQPSSVSQANNSIVPSSIASVIQQNSTKMFILTTTKPATNTSANESIPTTMNNSNNVTHLITNTSANGKSSHTPLLITTPIVNGDLKPIVSSNSLIKNALENTTTETKRLKTSQSSTNLENFSYENNNVVNSIVSNTLVTENKLPQYPTVKESLINHNDSVENNSYSISNSNDTSKPVLNTSVCNNPTISVNTSKVELEYECQWNDCRMYIF